MSKIGLIIHREYTSRVRKRSFIFITLLVPLVIAGLSFLGMWLSIQETKQLKVLIVDPSDLCGGKVYMGMEENPPVTFYFQQEDVGLDEFQHAEKYRYYDMLLGIDGQVITNHGIKGFYREKITPRVEYYIRDKVELRLEEYFATDYGISLNDYRRIRQEFNFHLENIDPEKRDTSSAQWVGFIFSTFIFIFIITYSSQVMRGVIEEKTSRVVEILVSSVKPIQLMMGKIIGIGLVGLTQFVVWIALVSLAFFFMRSFIFEDMMNPENLANAVGAMDGLNPAAMGEQLSVVTKESDLIYVIYQGIPWGTLLFLFTLYFIGGYLFYSGLFAVIGSAVDSETDSQQAALPIMLLLIFSYALGIMIIFYPGGPTALWFSQLPFSSSIIMLQRVASGTVQLWEVFLSLALLTGAFVVILYGAAKVYRTGILMYGKKASWKEIFKWLRY